MRFYQNQDVEFQLDRILNNGIEFDDNIRGSLVEVHFVDGLLSLKHTLGYTPTGFIVLWKDAESDVWATQLDDWNRETMYLASSVSNLRARLFVM